MLAGIQTRDEIMAMNIGQLEDCIAKLPMDDPLFEFALKQRDHITQRKFGQIAAISTSVGAGTLFILVSSLTAESVNLPLWLTNWAFLIAAILIFAVYAAILYFARAVRTAWSWTFPKDQRSR